MWQSRVSVEIREFFMSNTLVCACFQITQLVEDVQRLQASNAKLRESTAGQMQKLEEQLNQKNIVFQKLVCGICVFDTHLFVKGADMKILFEGGRLKV